MARGSTMLMIGGIMLGRLPALAEPVVERPELRVEAARLESAQVTGHDASVAANLLVVPGVRVLSQGLAAGQSDLSIRGSAFSGSGLTVAGIGLTSPQTEHFNVELPLVADTFATPRVRTGLDQLRAGTGHLAGTVELPLLPVESRRRVSFGGLERGGNWISGLVQQELPALSEAGRATGLGVFGSWLDIPNVDNVGNDVRQGGGGGRLQLTFPESVFDAIGGHQKKTFGARGYYGVTDAWDAEETLEYSLLLASWRQALDGDGFLRLSAAWRRIEDDYTLFWTLPGIFNNRHKTTIHDVLADGLVEAGDRYHVLWRLSGRDEAIRSTNLGSHSRASAQATLAPGLTLGAWRIDAGASYAHFESEPDRWLPQAGLSVQSGHTRYRLAYTVTIREPSFTELNYESPASLGDAGLGNQRAGTVEMGADGIVGVGVTWQAAIFHRVSRDTVDWVRETPESARWEATSLGSVRTTGAELGVQARTADGYQAGLAYAALSKSTAAGIHSSRYVLDYPEHHVALTGWLPVATRVAIEFRQALLRQTSNALRESRSTAAPAMLAVHITPGFDEHLRLSLAVDNLWDDRFETFAGQRTYSPRRATAGLTAYW